MFEKNNWSGLKKIFGTMFRDGWHLLSWLRSGVVSALCTLVLYVQNDLMLRSGILWLDLLVTLLICGTVIGLTHEIFWRIKWTNG